MVGLRYGDLLTMKIPLSLSGSSVFVWFELAPCKQDFEVLLPPLLPPPDPPPLQLFELVSLFLVLSEPLLLVVDGGNNVMYN